jgi:hypothetical protein
MIYLFRSDEELNERIKALQQFIEHTRKYRIQTEVLGPSESSAQQIVEFLTELRNYRQKDDHKPHEMTVVNLQITSITCTCGHETKYKVPLTTIFDFECPRKNRKENHAG